MRRMMQHAAGAGGARLIDLVGIDQEVLAHHRNASRQRCAACARCASAPSKRVGSVSTEIAAAPARGVVAHPRADVLAASLQLTDRRRAQFDLGDQIEAALDSASGGAGGGQRGACACSSRSRTQRARLARRARGSSCAIAGQKIRAHAALRPHAALHRAPKRSSRVSSCARRATVDGLRRACHRRARRGSRAGDLERQRGAEQQRIAMRAGAAALAAARACSSRALWAASAPASAAGVAQRQSVVGRRALLAAHAVGVDIEQREGADRRGLIPAFGAVNHERALDAAAAAAHCAISSAVAQVEGADHQVRRRGRIAQRTREC